jgi:hypothetical protein
MPCIREVNELSDHILELIEHKAGRSVEAVQFKVARKQNIELQGNSDGRNDVLVDEVAKLGIPRSEARKMLGQYGEQRVRAALAYVANRSAKKNATPVDNVAAYFRKALSHGYTLPDAPTPKTRELEEPPQRRQNQLRDKYLVQKMADAREYFGELEIDDQTALIERYNGTVDAKNLKLSPSKKPSKLAETGFFRWLVLDTWGEPSADELLEFVLAGEAAG